MTPKTPPGQTRELVYRFVRERLLEGFPPTVREIQEHFGFRAVQTAQEHLRRLVAEGRLVKQKGKARAYALPPGETVPARGTLFVPLLGRVQAGALTTAIEDCEGYIPVQTRAAGRGKTAAPFGPAGDSGHTVGSTSPSGATDDEASSRATGPESLLSPQYRDSDSPVPAGGDAHLQATPLPSGSGQLFALRVQGESMTGAGILPGDIVIVRSQQTARAGDIVVALVEDEATVKTLRIRRGRIELHAENPAFDPIVVEPDACRILGKVIETRRYLEPPVV